MLISPSLPKDSFTCYRTCSWWFFFWFASAWKRFLCYFLPASIVSDGKATVIWIGVLLCLMCHFSLAAFKVFFLVRILIMICLPLDFSGFIIFGVFSASWFFGFIFSTWDPDGIHECQLSSFVPRVTFFSVFSLLSDLHKLYWSVLKHTNPILCSLYSWAHLICFLNSRYYIFCLCNLHLVFYIALISLLRVLTFDLFQVTLQSLVKHFYDGCFKILWNLSSIGFLLGLVSTGCLFPPRLGGFPVLMMMGDFQVHSDHLGYYIRRLWVLFKYFLSACSHSV